MSDEALRQHLEELRRTINDHNHRYHVLDEPAVSDAEYDRLLAELRSIEDQHPEWITPAALPQRAGAQPSAKFSKVRHLPRADNLNIVQEYSPLVCYRVFYTYRNERVLRAS